MPATERTSALQLSVRAAVAAGLALSVAGLLRLPYPIYALVGAVIVTDLSPEVTRKLSVPRVAGTVLGAVMGALWSPLFGGTGAFAPLGVTLAVALAMFSAHLLRLESAMKVSGYVCGIVLIQFAVDPWTYALFRTIETVVGIGAALLVSLVPPFLGRTASRAP
jgi:uncharacterized membrane protein YgaE (UPF0421/DUF939 family)